MALCPKIPNYFRGLSGTICDFILLTSYEVSLHSLIDAGRRHGSETNDLMTHSNVSAQSISICTVHRTPDPPGRYTGGLVVLAIHVAGREPGAYLTNSNLLYWAVSLLTFALEGGKEIIFSLDWTANKPAICSRGGHHFFFQGGWKNLEDTLDYWVQRQPWMRFHHHSVPLSFIEYVQICFFFCRIR